MKLRHKRLIALLLSVSLTVLGIEGILSLDPLGVYYFRDLYHAMDYMVSTNAGYTYLPGVTQLTHSSFTMREDGTRLVPATNEDAEKTLVLLGDSVTFGWGVNDADTWANLIAQALPDWHVINAGISGYNSENVLRTLYLHENADAFVYLMVYNDALVTVPFKTGVPKESEPTTSWFSLYLEYLTNTADIGGPASEDRERFLRDLEDIQSDPRVLIVAFPGELTDFSRQAAPSIHEIPMFTHSNSRVDGHANAVGNRQIADALLPLVKAHLAAIGEA
jgi:lysophospholipase L1-like esterase